MKLYMYANYNKLGDFFTGIVAEKIEPDELVKSYRQIICNLDDKSLESLRECDLYLLGEFDNVEGVITPRKEFLLHISEAVDMVKSSKEVIDHGKETC